MVPGRKAVRVRGRHDALRLGHSTPETNVVVRRGCCSVGFARSRNRPAARPPPAAGGGRMIRLLPRTPRGTWLLAGAVWLAGVGALWYLVPAVPRAEWTLPEYAE